MNKMLSRQCLIAFVMLLIVIILGGWTQADPANTKKFADFVPKTLYVGCYELGTAFYMLAAPWVDAVAKKYGTLSRIIPASTEVGRQILLTSGQVDAVCTGTEAYTSSRGLFTFSTIEWGPNPIQAAWLAYRQDGSALFVRGDSDIKTLADLKGKRVAWYKGSAIHNEALTKGCLAFAGLTWADVIKVEVSSIPEGIEAFKAGKLDVAYGATSGPYARELEALRTGIRWLPMPADNIEGWKRVRAAYPGQSPVYCKVGGGVSKEKPVWLPSLLVVYQVMENKSPEYTYFITRSLHETFDVYCKTRPGIFDGWQIDINLSMLETSVVPYHQGSVQYFKDTGKWNDKLERLNQQKLNECKEVRRVWETVRGEALEKGIKSTDFPAYWDKRRVELFK